MVSSLQISLNMRDNLGDLRLDGTIIKLDIKEIGCEGVEWILLSWVWVLVEEIWKLIVVKFRLPYDARDLLII